MAPTALSLGTRFKTPKPVVVQSSIYTTLATHNLKFPGKRIVSAYVIPGAYGTTTPDKDVPAVSKFFMPLGTEGSSATKVYVPTNFGYTSPKILGISNDTIVIRAGGQPYTLVFFAEG